MATAQTSDERKAFVEAFTKEAALRREWTATGWKDGVAGEPVSELVCLAYVRGWVSGREAYNKNVHGTDGADPMPEEP